MGGTHLVGASSYRVRETVAALRRYKVQQILLSHCNGLDAHTQAATAFQRSAGGLPAGPAFASVNNSAV